MLRAPGPTSAYNALSIYQSADIQPLLLAAVVEQRPAGVDVVSLRCGNVCGMPNLEL